MTENNVYHTLGLSDLRLLMDNYQNIVQMNAILLEQQKQVTDLQKDILKKQDDISKAQFQVCNSMDIVATKLDNCAENFLKINEHSLQTYAKINDTLIHNFDKVEDKIEVIHIDNTKDHSGITNKIYVALVGSGIVIASLITLLLTVYDKYKIVSHIQTMVQELVKKFIG